MTPEKQRIAIGEFCGWKRVVTETQVLKLRATQWTMPDGTKAHPHEVSGDGLGYLPDYPNDLNAMHEAVATAPEEVKHTYAVILAGMLWKPEQTRGWLDWRNTLAVSEASAAQRSEALLRTISKWEPA